MIRLTTSRRCFLQTSLGNATAIGIGTSPPSLFAQAAKTISPATDRILVVVQLSGGNDGLNTVVPYADDAYRAARPKLAIRTEEVLVCNDHVGFHPALTGLRKLLESGQLAVIQGVGYDQPNRSHFESMDIWHTCRRKEQTREEGWLGRFLNIQASAGGADVPALHLGQEQQPFALISKNVRVPTLRDLDEFQLSGLGTAQDRRELRRLLDECSQRVGGKLQPTINEDHSLLDFLQSSTTSALAASQSVSEASRNYSEAEPYPQSELGHKLRTIAQLIDAELSTKVYYVQLDGFDTHARQALSHAALLRQWSDAVTAFVRDLEAHNHSQRVCVMTFSEFGRRVSENASEGTDHGAAGPMFLCGDGLRGGLIGTPPSLTDLIDGDLKFAIDFRGVYAEILESWFGVASQPILGQTFPPVPLFS